MKPLSQSEQEEQRLCRRDERLCWALPLFALAVSFGMFYHELLTEPWGSFQIRDAIIQFGGAFVVAITAFAWFCAVIQRRRPVMLLMLPIVGLSLLYAISTTSHYSTSPW